MKANPDFAHEMMTICHGSADFEKVRDLIDRVYQAGLLATTDRDAARWRKLENDIDLRGKFIRRQAVPMQRESVASVPNHMSITSEIYYADEMELVIHWLDAGGAHSLDRFLDQRIANTKNATPGSSD